MPHTAEQSNPHARAYPTSPAVVRDRLEELDRIRRTHQVIRLSLIGSSLRGDFDQANSDLDFVVDFEPDSPGKRDNADRAQVADHET